jgi:hypothetical protein
MRCKGGSILRRIKTDKEARVDISCIVNEGSKRGGAIGRQKSGVHGEF